MMYYVTSLSFNKAKEFVTILYKYFPTYQLSYLIKLIIVYV